MSHNLKIVEYFVDAFHKNKLDEVTYIISPRFSFTLNSREKLDFETYSNRVKFLNERTHFQIGPPKSKNDRYFYSEIEMKLPNQFGELEEAFGKAEFIVENGLILALNARYYKSKEEYDEFSRLLENSHIAFV